MNKCNQEARQKKREIIFFEIEWLLYQIIILVILSINLVMRADKPCSLEDVSMEV